MRGLARRASGKALQPIPGQTIAWGKLGGGIRPDGAGLLKHHHVVFYLAFTQVQSVCDLIEGRSLVPVARLPENAKDSEYDCCITFRHACLLTAWY
jgi:hypothetical protein